jgi:hypothetical protein
MTHIHPITFPEKFPLFFPRPIYHITRIALIRVRNSPLLLRTRHKLPSSTVPFIRTTAEFGTPGSPITTFTSPESQVNLLSFKCPSNHFTKKWRNFRRNNLHLLWVPVLKRFHSIVHRCIAPPSRAVAILKLSPHPFKVSSGRRVSFWYRR